MRKYALIMITDNGLQVVQFYDDYNNAVEGYNIGVTVLGWRGELYAYEQKIGYTKLM